MRRPLGLIALLLVGASFLLPEAASALLPAALRAEGLRSDSITASVEAWPPQELLLGRATRVSVTAGGVSYAPVTAGTVTITLDDVDLLARRTGAVRGTLRDVTVDGSAIGAVTVDGSSIDELAFQAIVPPDTLQGEIQRAVGGSVTLRALLPPDVVVVGIGPVVARPTVSVGPDGRSLRLAAGGLPLSVSLLVLQDGAPIRLRRVRVVPGGLMIEGTLDLGGFSLRPT